MLNEPLDNKTHHPNMNTLIKQSIALQRDLGNDTCPFCYTRQYGSAADLGVRRDAGDSIIDVKLTKLAGHFFVRLDPGAEHKQKMKLQ